MLHQSECDAMGRYEMVLGQKEKRIPMTDNRTTELQEILDEFEHECFMLRVEASETCARDDVVRKSYERIRDEFAGRIAETLGERTCHIEHMPKNQNLRCRSWLGCSVCGCEIENPGWNYCPDCGRKVVDA